MLHRLDSPELVASLAGRVDRAPIEQRQKLAKRRLATLNRSSTLGEHIGDGGSLRDRWADLTLTRQEQIVAAVLDHVVVRPGRRGFNQFDPARLSPVWQRHNTRPRHPPPGRASAPTRTTRRRRPDPSLIRTDDPLPPRPQRRPPTQPRPAHDPRHPTPNTPAHDRLHQPAHERRKEHTRSDPLPQALPRPQPLPTPREPATDDLTDREASLAQAKALIADSGTGRRETLCRSSALASWHDPAVDPAAR